MSTCHPSDARRRHIPQAGAIPFRYRGDRLQFCVITSVKRRHWIFPKGIVDPGETPQQTALKETLEEAGLVGEIVGAPVGQYDYSKWNSRLSVTVFLMRVTRTEDHWLESDMRERRWLDAAEAIDLLNKKELKSIAREAKRRLQPA